MTLKRKKSNTVKVHCKYYDADCVADGLTCPFGEPFEIVVEPDDHSVEWCFGECQFKGINLSCIR